MRPRSDGWEWPQPPPPQQPPRPPVPGPPGPPRPPGPPPGPPGPPPGNGRPPGRRIVGQPDARGRRLPEPPPGPAPGLTPAPGASIWEDEAGPARRHREGRPPRDPRAAAPERERPPRTTLWLALGVAALSFVLRAYTALAGFETTDERGWMDRSSRFWGALSSLDFAGTSAGSQGYGDSLPGIPTMWVGALARGLWSAGASFGLWDKTDPASLGGASGFTYTRSGLNVAQITMALVTSLLLAGLIVLLVAWVGRVAAGVAGVLIATEPFLVAHGSILGTDELMALLALATLIAAALALGLPNITGWAGRGRVGALAGGLLMLTVLTKASALLLLVPPLGLLSLWALVRVFGRRGVGSGWRPLFRVLIFAGIAAGVVFVVANPALWGDPMGQVRMIAKAALGGDAGGVRQFFLGDSVLTPGPTFYLIALPFRMTPWLLIAGVVSLVALWFQPSTRGFGIAVLMMAVPPLAWLSISARQFDRYGLLLVLLVAVAVGVAVTGMVESLAAGERSDQLRWVGIGAATLVGVYGLLVAPWGIAYYNPAMGGSGSAEDALRIGWGEGMEQAGGLVTDVVEMGGGSCDDVTVSGYWSLVSQQRCGRLPQVGEEPDYVVVYVTERQGQPTLTERYTEGRAVVAEKSIRGVTYVQVYGPRAVPGAPVAPAGDASTDTTTGTTVPTTSPAP